MDVHPEVPEPPAPLPSGPKCQETCKELADTLRSLLDHESEAIHQRMGWLGTFQGLLLAGTGVMWDKSDKKPVYLFCSLGLAVSLTMWAGLFAASIATDNVKKWWDENAPKDYWGPGVISFYRPKGRKWIRAFAPWFAIPALFVLSWIGIIALNYLRVIPPLSQPIPVVCKQECTSVPTPPAQAGKPADARSASHKDPSPRPRRAAP